ncbi:MAG: hypothetical protein U0414_44360 [Polyangiaceae bacterium]
MSFWRRWFGGSKKSDEPAPVREELPRPESVPAKKKRKRLPPPAILGKTFNHPEGGICGAMPIADVWIQGVPCAANTTVSFHRNGRVLFAVLARAHTIDGDTLPAGAQVSFESDGSLSAWVATRAEDFATRVMLASKEWVTITLPAGSKITMERGGTFDAPVRELQLRAVTLVAPLTIDGRTFPAQTELIFGDSGSLSHATCPEPLELAGVRFACETIVFEFGFLREGSADGDGVVDGVPYQSSEIVRFHDNGRLARCYLSEDTTLSEVPCKAGTRVYLDGQGRLVEGTVAIDTVIAHVPVAAGSVVNLDEGVPAALSPREDIELDTIPCAKGQLVELDAKGRVVRATLARDRVLDGWQLPAGSTVVLDDARRLARVVAADATPPDGRRMPGTWRTDLVDGAVRMQLPVKPGSVAGSLTLRESATIGGLVAAKGSNVEIEDGIVVSLVLANDQPVGAHTAKGGTRVHLRPDGTPRSLYLASDARIDDIPCAGARTLGAIMNDVEHTYREHTRFGDDGALAHATLAEDAVVTSIPLAGNETIARWPNGTLHVGTLAQRWTHPLGYVARAKTLLGQFDDGSPSLITLDEPFGEHAAGTVLSFAAPGVVKSVGAAKVPLGPCDPIT